MPNILFDENGADINKTNKNGELPLLICCKYGKEDFAKVLIKYGADINKNDNKGNKLGHSYIVTGVNTLFNRCKFNTDLMRNEFNDKLENLDGFKGLNDDSIGLVNGVQNNVNLLSFYKSEVGSAGKDSKFIADKNSKNFINYIKNDNFKYSKYNVTDPNDLPEYNFFKLVNGIGDISEKDSIEIQIFKLIAVECRKNDECRNIFNTGSINNINFLCNAT